MSHFDIIRLPVQHPRHPHCPECEGPLPAFDDASLSMNPTALGDCTLLALTFRVLCPCGLELLLEKEMVNRGR